MKRVGLKCYRLEPLRSWACSPARRRTELAPREQIKRNRGRTALLALVAELRCSRNCARTREQESRRKRRNLSRILFPKNVGVKENRKTFCAKERRDNSHASLAPRPDKWNLSQTTCPVIRRNRDLAARLGDSWPGTPQGGESLTATKPCLRAGQCTEPFPLSAVFTLVRATQPFRTIIRR